MIDFLQLYYGWILSFHIIAVMFWMAGLYYLPRLFVYHCEALEKAEKGDTFSIMEEKLLRIIMAPSMLAAWGFGILLILHYTAHSAYSLGDLWLVLKLGFVLILSAYHGFLSATHKRFCGATKAPYKSRTLRILNEIPPLLTIIIVLLVVLKPL